LRLPFSEHDVLLPYILPRDRFIITRANSPSIFRSTSADFSAALLEEGFGSLPEALVTRIEQTENLDQLRAAARQVFRLTALEDLNL